MKDVFKLAVKVFSYTFIAIFCVFLFSLALSAMFERKFFMILFSVIAIFSVVSLPYLAAWRQGRRDENLVKVGHIKKSSFKGLFAGLIAAVPSAALITAFLVIGSGEEMYKVIYEAVVRIWFFAFAISFDMFFKTPALLYCYLIPPILGAGLGYILGYKEISLTEKIIYKKSK